MKNENVSRNLRFIKDICIFCLLSIWFIIPLLKEITFTSLFTVKNEYIFIEIVGMIGIYMLIFNIYKNFMNSENKKEYLKEILPICIFTLYMIWTLISSIFSPDTNKAFYGTEFRKDGYITYLAYAGFFGCAFLLNSKKMKKGLLNLFLLSAVLTLIFIKISPSQHFYKLFWMKGIEVGVFDNSNHYGYYLLLATTVSSLLFITEKNKLLKIVYVVVYTYLLYYLIKNNTFGCYLALFTTLVLILIYSIYKKEKIYICTIPIVIFIMISCVIPSTARNLVTSNVKVLYNDIVKIKNSIENSDDENEKREAENAGSGRIKLWINGIKFFVERPILGYGPENLGAKYKEIRINQDRPHNLIIQLATTSGLPGLLLYITALAIILKRGFNILRDNNEFCKVFYFTIIAYLISAMFGNSMYYTSPYFFILLGFLMYEIIDKKQIRKEIEEKNK